MTGWMKALLIAGGTAAGAAVIAAAVYFGLPYLQQKAPPAAHAPVTSSTSPDFTKTAYQVDSSGNLVLDSNGNPVPFTGSVHVGDEVEYVLTYKVPTTGATGPVTITDTLSANQTYVDPSIQAPPGWTYPTSPGYPGNAETYSNPGMGPGTGFTMTVVPIGPAVGLAGNSTGDGFQPIPVAAAGHIYSVWHHMPNPQPGSYAGVMCWNASDLSPCVGYSKLISAAGGGNMITPHWPHAVVVGTKFYFPASREQANNTTADLGIGCWDTVTEAACPFITLPGSPTFPFVWSSITTSQYGAHSTSYLAGVVTDPAQPTHLIVNVNNQLYCIDATTSAPCAAWASSPPLAGATMAGQFRDMIAEDSGGSPRVFVEYNGGTASARIACRVLATGANCPGWALVGGSSETVLPLKTGNYMTISPVPDAGPGWLAVCAHQALQGPPACLKTADGTTYTMPAIFGTAAGPFNGTDNNYAPGGNGRYVIAAFRIPGTRQVLYPYYISRTQPFCFDFATSAPCAGFNAAWNSDNVTPNSTLGAARDYGYAADPTDPEHCLLGLGDHEILWRFRRDGAMGRGVCSQQHMQQTFNIDDQFCAKKPKEANWTNVEIVGRPPELVGGTITITNSAGTVVQTIAVTSANSYPVNLAATGTDATLTVAFTPNYGTNTPPTAAYQVKLDYTADVDPQICYKVKVLDCTEGAPQIDASNHAVYTDALGTKAADVNLGKVVGGHCGPPPCLLDLQSSITVNPDGTGTLAITGSGPPGFNPTILNVHTTTAGVGIAPPTRTVPPGPINTTFVLTGITPGQSVDIQIDAVDPGAGTNGSDKCCSSTITVIVPRDDHHHHTDVAIQKSATSEGQGPANGSGYIYTLAVSNISDPVPGSAIVVTDVVPAGLSFASATGTSWNCQGPFPIAAGGTLTCTYTGGGMIATGQNLPPITIVSTNAIPGAQLPQVTNCARIALVPAAGLTDYNPSNDQSCVTGGTQAGTQDDLGIHKTVATHGHGPDILGYTYTLAVTNLGAPVNGQNTVTVTDVVPAGISFASATGTNWNCPGPFPIAAGGTLTCTYAGSGALTTGQPLPTIAVTTGSFVAGAVAPPITNCADVAFAAGSGLTDGNASNNHSCASTGTVTVIKVVKPAQGHDVSTAEFYANVSCALPDGTTTASGYALSPADNYTQVVSNVPASSVCTISETTPLPATDDPANCHWDTTYPDGQQATVTAGNVTAHIVNTETCGTKGAEAVPTTTVTIAKAVVIDGKISHAPHEAFPIRASCVQPDGKTVSLNYTASAALGFDSVKQTVPAGTKCTVREPPPPPPPGRRLCHWETTYQFNGKPVRAFPVTLGGRAGNVIAVRNELVCEDQPTDESCAGTGHWNGRRCVTCERGETWDDAKRICTVPRLICHAPMVLNDEGTACECPEGTTLKNGTCRKRGSFLDDVLGHTHFGIGGGTGGHRGGGDTQPPGK
ncbi:MAG: DUF5979 domain-containing protein [Rhizomicrobium sp.]